MLSFPSSNIDICDGMSSSCARHLCVGLQQPKRCGAEIASSFSRTIKESFNFVYVPTFFYTYIIIYHCRIFLKRTFLFIRIVLFEYLFVFFGFYIFFLIASALNKYYSFFIWWPKRKAKKLFLWCDHVLLSSEWN